MGQLWAMPKLPCCDRCKFYAHSPYMVCAINPYGVAGDECSDFNPSAGPVSNDDDPLSWYNDVWEPVGASYYGDELVLSPVQQLTLEQRLTLLDWHPIFTGRCPNCEHPIRQSEPARVHWDCLPVVRYQTSPRPIWPGS